MTWLFAHLQARFVFLRQTALHSFPERKVASTSPFHVPVPVPDDARSHDDAGDWDAAALVAVALDALCLAAAAGGLGGLDDALDCRDGCGAGSVGHFVL